NPHRRVASPHRPEKPGEGRGKGRGRGKGEGGGGETGAQGEAERTFPPSPFPDGEEAENAAARPPGRRAQRRVDPPHRSVESRAPLGRRGRTRSDRPTGPEADPDVAHAL